MDLDKIDTGTLLEIISYTEKDLDNKERIGMPFGTDEFKTLKEIIEYLKKIVDAKTMFQLKNR